MAILFWASSRPGSDAPSSIPDSLLHAAAYFVLGTLTIRAFAEGLAEPPAAPWRHRLLVSAFVFSLLFGVSDEWHQSFVPGRDPSARDVAWDALGALVAVSVVGVFWRWRSTETELQRRSAR